MAFINEKERFSFISTEHFKLKGLSSTWPLADSALILPSPLDFACGLFLLQASRQVEASNMTMLRTTLALQYPVHVTTRCYGLP